jgi:hypothetical protein
MKFTYIGDQSNKEVRTAGSYANSAYLTGNSAFVKANSAYDSQNTTGAYANSAYAQANTATDNAAAASQYANAAFIQANAAFAQANTGGSSTDAYARDTANAAFDKANTSSNTALTVYTDQFTANGLTTTFTLSANPPDENFVTAVVDGIIQLRSTYTVTNNIITFDSTFENGAKVEVTTLSGNTVINTVTSGGVSTGKSIAMSIIFGI